MKNLSTCGVKVDREERQTNPEDVLVHKILILLLIIALIIINSSRNFKTGNNPHKD